MNNIEHPSEQDLINHFEYLDDLRDSGEVNMYGAPPYLEASASLGKQEAIYVWNLWIRCFDKNTTALKRVREISKHRKISGIE